MKILALSLLRVGDFFQHLHLAKQLRGSGHEVHFLIHDECQSLVKLCTDYEFHIFPRKKLGRQLVSRHTHPLMPFHLLDEWLKKMNQLEFDEIQNWTHDRFSAKLMGMLSAPSKRGALMVQGKDVTCWRPGLRYLDEHWGASHTPTLSYIEALALAMEIPAVSPAPFRLNSTGPVVLQVTTSDVKKTWSLRSWIQLASLLADQGEEVVVVTAPEELISVSSGGWDSRIQVRGLDWIKTWDLLKRAKLLISGDTSVLHLAVHAETRVLGLYLGSANAKKTGPFQYKARTLTPQIECHPCYHRSDCRSQDHRCHDLITIQMVMDEFKLLLKCEVNSSYETQVGLVLAEQVQGPHQNPSSNIFENIIENRFNENGDSYGPRP